jgi:hypothetical protein
MHDWKNCKHIVKSVKSSNWKCNQQKRKWIKNAILKSRSLFYAIQRIIDIDILNDIKAEQCKSKEKNNNDKKSDNEKKSENDISNVKFVNMTNMKSFKYASLFINKTFNNLLWRSVIYDSNCNDSFIYDLNRFVNEITLAHELIDTFNDSMMIEEYEIMLVTNHINDKNRRMFFENIAYVSFTDVILMFVTRLKKQDFVWDMYKKALMKKSIDAVICDIEKKHDLLLKRYVIEKYFNKSIDDKKLISTKSNLIYWSEYWLFDALLLRDIEIYLYSTIYEMKSFDVDLDSFTCRLYVVFRSWCEYHEMNFFVNRSIKLSFEISCLFFSSFVENLSMINESKDSIDWRIIKIVKQVYLIESDDEMIKCDVFVLKTKT